MVWPARPLPEALEQVVVKIMERLLRCARHWPFSGTEGTRKEGVDSGGPADVFLCCAFELFSSSP